MGVQNRQRSAVRMTSDPCWRLPPFHRETQPGTTNVIRSKRSLWREGGGINLDKDSYLDCKSISLKITKAQSLFSFVFFTISCVPKAEAQLSSVCPTSSMKFTSKASKESKNILLLHYLTRLLPMSLPSHHGRQFCRIHVNVLFPRKEIIKKSFWLDSHIFLLTRKSLIYFPKLQLENLSLQGLKSHVVSPPLEKKVYIKDVNLYQVLAHS